MVFQNDEMIQKSNVWAPGLPPPVRSRVAMLTPEIHNLDGKWYLYYTLDSKSYVLKGGAKVRILCRYRAFIE